MLCTTFPNNFSSLNSKNGTLCSISLTGLFTGDCNLSVLFLTCFFFFFFSSENSLLHAFSLTAS